MTLPELLISVTMMGVIATVLAASITVTFRQADNTEGRLNVARAEQTVDMYLPNDLASAETIDQDPDASPCGSSCPPGVDLSGSNALMISWTTTASDGTNAITVTHNVSYHFSESDVPGTYQLVRIHCQSAGSGWTCESVTVLTDIELLTNWSPGDPVPESIITVSEPLAPDAISEDQIASASQRKDANRVVVTINGGGDSDGAGGGLNRISITAGGTSRSTIPADSIVNAPTFTQARSRCGGPIALIIDDSGSIGSAMGTVEDGVVAFVETFAGTPTKLKLVRFDREAGFVGDGSSWTRYFDMTEPADVAALSETTIRNTLSAGGGTNWEDAMFATFYDRSGQDLAQVQPELAVFFTDGEPTYERLRYRYDNGGDIPNQPLPGPGWPTWDGGYYSNGSDYTQVGFNRAKWIADQVRGSTRLIGVGVGAAFERSSQWIESPGRGWHWEYQRGSRQYQQAPRVYEVAAGYESRLDTEKASAFESNIEFESRIDYEIRRNGDWENADPAEYYAWTGSRRIDGTRSWYDVTAEEYFTWGGDSNWRTNGTRRWSAVSESLYDANNVNSGNNDGWRIDAWTNVQPSEYFPNASSHKYRINGDRNWYTVSAGEYAAYSSMSPGDWRLAGWASISQAEYDANNTTPDESDGYRLTVGNWTWITKEAYQAGNTTLDESDGFRDVGKQWVYDDDDALDWEPYPTTSTGGGYRRIQKYSEPYDSFESPSTFSVPNRDILATLVAGDDGAVEWNGEVPGNAKVADLFVLENYSTFVDALQSVALAECGGTLTVATRVGANRAADPFSYQNSKVFSSAGDDLDIQPTVVTTSSSFPTGTFDFEIPDGSFVTVELMPHNLSDLTGYSPVGWSCASGTKPITDLEFPPVNDVEYPGWTGVRVKVAANQAISCTLNVTR